MGGKENTKRSLKHENETYIPQEKSLTKYVKRDGQTFPLDV